MNAKTPAVSRLENARDRIEKAVDQIETAYDARNSMDSGAAEAEQVRLRLSEVETKNASLRDANDEVSRRLDSVIGRLKAVLKE
jgi:Domain of unknown function (DUF4164)